MFLLIFVSFAMAEDPQQQVKESKAKLQQIIETLEQIHPQAAHSESERTCRDALLVPEEAQPSGFAECIKVARDHGVLGDETRPYLDEARKRFPNTMAKQTDAFWLQKFDAGMVTYQQQQAKHVVVGPRPLP